MPKENQNGSFASKQEVEFLPHGPYHCGTSKTQSTRFFLIQWEFLPPATMFEYQRSQVGILIKFI